MTKRNTTRTTKQPTKRTTKRTTTKQQPAAKQQPASKQPAKQQPTFSAARVLLACGVTNAKVGRALLRAHNVERTEKAIKAFFAARAKQRKQRA